MADVVISVGMGPGQLTFIKRLKELGYCVLSFGKGRNSSEAIALSDYSAEIDTKDYHKAIKWINSLDVNVIAVGSFAGGAAVVTVQYLSNYYQTPTAIPENLIVSKDKKEQQKLLETFHLSSIQTWRAGELNERIISSIPNDEFIVKPASGRGSEGIYFIKRGELIKKMASGSLSYDDVIQEVIHGIEYRSVMIVQNGKLRLLAPIVRKSYKDTVYLGILSYTDKDLNRLISFIESFVNKAGIHNSIFKADILVSENSINMIELDIGVGGGSYYKKYVSELYSRDLMDEYIALITGKTVSDFVIVNPTLVMEYVFNHYPYPVEYNLEECEKRICKKFGPCVIQVNRLHPETKGGYNSNADFIFTVIYNSPLLSNDYAVDEFVNKELFKKDEQVI